MTRQWTRRTIGFLSINEDLTEEQMRINQEKRKLLRQHHLNKLSKRMVHNIYAQIEKHYLVPR